MQIQSTRRQHILKYGKTPSDVLNPVASSLTNINKMPEPEVLSSHVATPDLTDPSILLNNFSATDQNIEPPMFSYSESDSLSSANSSPGAEAESIASSSENEED